MATRRPIVNIAGVLQELPVGDVVPTGAVSGGIPVWWILSAETVDVPDRSQYNIHGEFRNEGEIRLGVDAELRVMA